MSTCSNSAGGFGDPGTARGSDSFIACYPVSTADLEELLALWIAAEKAITTGQNYSVEGLSVSRADLPTVIARIKDLSAELCNRKTAASGGRPGVLSAIWKS